MRTRCPACQTVFRVSAEQLRVRDGKVRCGHCGHVFNAHNTLDGDEATPPTAAPPFKSSGSIFVLEERPPRESGADEQAKESSPALGHEVDSKSESRVTGGAKADAQTKANRGEAAAQRKSGPAAAQPGGATIPTALFMKKASAPEPKSVIARSTLRTPTAAPVPSFKAAKASPAPTHGAAAKYLARDGDDRHVASDDDAAATRQAGETEGEAPPPLLDSVAEAAVGPPRPPSVDARTDRALRPNQYTSEPPETTETPRTAPTALDAPVAAGEAAALAESTERDVETDASASLASDDDATPPEASEPAEERALAALDDLPAKRSENPLRMSLLAGALIAVLGAQTALMYRKALAQDVPALRPFLTTLCANVGCSMALPRDASKIRIEVSDLNRLPEKDDAFVLSATLRNESTDAQAYPHLELTLTNAQDRAVARRVITPQEWMASTPSERGFGPREEVELVVNFTAANLNASGYRLYVFNP